MKDKIRDYIGHHGRVRSIRQIKNTNLILNGDGVFCDPPFEEKVEVKMNYGDPIIVLQKLVNYHNLYVVICPEGITWIGTIVAELDDGHEFPHHGEYTHFLEET